MRKGITYPYPPQITLEEAKHVHVRHGWDDLYTFEEFAERMKERGTTIITTGGVSVELETDTKV